MKKLVFIFVAMLLLAGCTIEAPIVYDPELRLVFLPEVYRHLTDEDETVYPETQDFYVCAWSEDKEWLELSRAYSQEVVITDTLRKTQATDVLWAFGQNVMWPSKNQPLSFSAYSPCDEQCAVSQDKGVQWSTDVLQEQVDLLYSHVEVDRRGNVDGNVVHLPFSHALCQLRFRVKNRVDNTGALDPLNRPDKITVNKITIDGVKHSGSFCSLPSPQWTLDDDKAPLPVFEGTYQTAGVPEPIGTAWLMVPQEFDTAITVDFCYTTFANTTITQVIKTVPLKTRLENGRDYIYTLSVGIDDVKFLQELIEDKLK